MRCSRSRQERGKDTHSRTRSCSWSHRTLRGGSSLTEVVKGFGATVDVDAQFLAAQSQVTALTLANVKLGTSANTLAANLPARLETLDWKNTALTAFPTALRTFESLQFLYESDRERR